METKELQFAVFKIGDIKFGIDIMKVREITRYQKTTGIPGTPSFIEGVMNLRGVIIPVVDLRKRFGLESKRPDKKSRIIVAFILKRLAGLLVDEVIEVARISSDILRPPPQIGKSIGGEYIKGVYEKNEDIVFIVDFDKLLSAPEQEAYLDFHRFLKEKKEIEPEKDPTKKSDIETGKKKNKKNPTPKKKKKNPKKQNNGEKK